MNRIFKILMGLCLVVAIAITSAVPLFADEPSVLSYTLSDEEMLAFLSTCTAKYTLFAGSSSYTGSCNFVHDSNSDSPGYYVLDSFSSGGPGVISTFDLDFSLSLTASSISIEHFACTVYGSDNSLSSSKAQSLSCKVNTNGFPSNSSSFDAQYNLKGSYRPVLANRSTFDFNPPLSVSTFSASFNSSYPMQQYVYVYYGIKSITYTAPAPLVYELQDAVRDIVKNGDKNTDRIIENHNANTDRIIEELGLSHQEDIIQREELTDKIIGSLDTPTDDMQSQVDDFSNQIDDTDQKLDDLAEDMHIDVPDLSTDLDLSIIDDNLDFEVISPVFNAIFGYPWVITMILVSLSISLLGVIIRGKNL